MTAQVFTADFLYTDGQRLDAHALVVQDGVITAACPISDLTPTQKAEAVTFPRTALTPGFVNTHTHTFQSLLKGICDDQDFFTWRDQALYKYALQMTSDDLYAGALLAFAEMLKTGVTTVCDFFYIHDQANDNAETIIRAARDLGMRIVLARTMYDWDGAPARFHESVSEAVVNTEALVRKYADHPMIRCLPAPHSLHGASVPMIEAGADLASRLGTMWHMHVAEGQYERQMIEERHGLPPIRFLDSLGVLNEQMVGIHCVWLDDGEIDLMAARQAKISYNPSSNMFLGDGITRLDELTKAGVTVALGTDGGCSNNRASILDEMRMANLLQKVRFCDATRMTAGQAFAMGTAHGGDILGQKLGRLAPGYGADFNVIRLDDLSVQPEAMFGNNLVYSMMPSAIHAVYAAGQRILYNGILDCLPEAEILARVQETHRRWGLSPVC